MAGFVPSLERPPLQELVRGSDPDYGWRVLVVCVLLNRAGRAQAERSLSEILERWQTPGRLAMADLGQVVDACRPCGFQNRRALTLVELSEKWIRRRRAILSGEATVAELPGVGAYAVDAFAVFVGGRTDADPDDAVLAAWCRLHQNLAAGAQTRHIPSR